MSLIIVMTATDTMEGTLSSHDKDIIVSLGFVAAVTVCIVTLGPPLIYYVQQRWCYWEIC